MGSWQDRGGDRALEELGEPAAGLGGGIAGRGARRSPERQARSMVCDEASAAVGARQRRGVRAIGWQARGSEPEQPADSAGVRAFHQERRAGEGAHPGGPGTISQGIGGVGQWARRSRAQRGRGPGSQAVGTGGQCGAGADARPAASAGLRCRGGCPCQALVGVGAGPETAGFIG